MSDLPRRDRRATVMVVVTLIAVVIALVQRTSIAPFPHSVDDFVGGFAVGAGIAAAFAWFGSRS